MLVNFRSYVISRILSFAVAFITSASVWAQSPAHIYEGMPGFNLINEECASLQPLRGDEYWPWSLAIPFPWKEIQGTWKARYEDGSTFYFTFSIVRSDREVKQLRVTQYSSLETCSVTASGVGREYANQINAQMNLKADGSAFRILMAAFQASDLPKLSACSGPVMGMSMVPFGQAVDKAHNMPLFKVSPRVTCKTNSSGPKSY